jgi:hypothetical protein
MRRLARVWRRQAELAVGDPAGCRRGAENPGARRPGRRAGSASLRRAPDAIASQQRTDGDQVVAAMLRAVEGAGVLYAVLKPVAVFWRGCAPQERGSPSRAGSRAVLVAITRAYRSPRQPPIDNFVPAGRLSRSPPFSHHPAARAPGPAEAPTPALRAAPAHCRGPGAPQPRGAQENELRPAKAGAACSRPAAQRWCPHITGSAAPKPGAALAPARGHRDFGPPQLRRRRTRARKALRGGEPCHDGGHRRAS